MALIMNVQCHEKRELEVMQTCHSIFNIISTIAKLKFGEIFMK